MGKKRGNQEGSIYQRKDGRWVAVVDLGWQNGQRARKYLYGSTQAAVVDRLTDERKAAKDGVLIRDDRQTVGQFLECWLDDCCAPRVRRRTLRSYRDTVRLHITPTLGRIPLTKLTPQQVQKWLNDLRGAAAASRPKVGRPAPAGLSPRTVAYSRTVLRIALGQAMRWGLVQRNAAALVSPPRVERKEVEPFTLEEARSFIEAVQGHRLEALYTVALALGLRQGEALGLRWEDVDVEGGTLSVRFQIQRVKGEGLLLVELKTTSSRRAIELPETVIKALRSHRVRQLEERLAAGADWREKGLVFTTGIGTALDPRNVLAAFKRLLTATGLRSQRFHDLRHGAATLLLAQGVSARAIMDLLGHSQIGITYNLYSHVIPELRRDAARKMDSILTAPVEDTSLTAPAPRR